MQEKGILTGNMKLDLKLTGNMKKEFLIRVSISTRVDTRNKPAATMRVYLNG